MKQEEEIPSITLPQYYILTGFKGIYYSRDEKWSERLDDSKRLRLAEIYSNWMLEPAPDINCGECVDEMFRRLMLEQKRFERAQSKYKS